MIDFQILLLAVSLSLDALVIGISYGFRKIFVPTASKLVITFISFIITGLSIVLGSAMLLVVPAIVAKILGPAMLFIFGLFTIIKGFRNNTNNSKRVCRSKDNIIKITKKLSMTLNLVTLINPQKLMLQNQLTWASPFPSIPFVPVSAALFPV